MTAEVQLRNTTPHEFVDISSEARRCYRFPGSKAFPNGEHVVIDNPQWLSVSARGGHRLVDISGVCYYIAPGWLSITWFPRLDEPHFVR